MAAAALGLCWGRLLIPGTEGAKDVVYSIEKPLTIIGRDQQCDIRIVNREVSRKHVQLEVDEDSGRVTLASIGREPVSVNGDTVLHASPVELFSGYEIEVHLEGRSRVMVFETDSDETLVLAPSSRRPLSEQDANNLCTGPITIGPGPLGKRASSRKRSKPGGDAEPPPRKTSRSSAKAGGGPGKAAPPPPPPPPPGALLRKAPAPPAAAAPKPRAAPAARPVAGRIDPLELQNALKAGLAGLKKAKESTAAKPRATPKGAKKPAFVPDSQELVKLRSRLRKTSDDAAAGGPGGAGYCDFLGKGQTPAAAAAKAAARAPTPRSAAKGRRKSSLSSGAAATASSAVVSASPAATGRRASLRRSVGSQPTAAPAEAAAPAPEEPAVQKAEQSGSAEADPAAEGLAVMDTVAAVADEAGEEATAADEVAPTEVLADAAEPAEDDAMASGQQLRGIKKRKTVRFSLPLAVLDSPEGVPRDATAFNLNDVPLEQRGEVVHVDADNTMAISAWAMGTAGDAASPADGAAASPQPALPQIPPERRRSGSRLRNSSGGSELLAPIAEENYAFGSLTTPESSATSRSGRRSLSSRPATPAARRSDRRSAGGAEQLPALSPALAAGTPNSMLRAAAARQHESARRGSGVSVHFTSPVAGAAAPTATPVTGQRHSLRGQPDAAAFRARLQAVAAAQQGELTVELPADFFASPQSDLTMRATPEAVAAGTAPAGASPVQQQQANHVVFHAIADAPAAGGAGSPASALKLRVPAACLPASPACHEALEAASQAGSAEAGARQLTLAIAEALGAVPSGGDAAAALAGVQARAQRRIADATVTARLATTKAQKLAGQLGAAERRAAKLRDRNATLAKLLARERGLRADAEAALAAAVASAVPAADPQPAAPATAPAAPAAGPPVADAGIVPTGANEAAPPAPAPAAVTAAAPGVATAVSGASPAFRASARAAPTNRVLQGRTPVRREREIARVAAASAPTPVLPRWPFISPRGGKARPRRGGDDAPAQEEVPAWLFCGEPLGEDELAALAQDIDETAEQVADALRGSHQDDAESAAAEAAADAAADAESKEAAAKEAAPAAAPSPLPRRISVVVGSPAVVASPVALPAAAAPAPVTAPTADTAMEEATAPAPPPSAAASPAAAPPDAASPAAEAAASAQPSAPAPAAVKTVGVEEDEVEDLCRVCGKDAGNKVMLLCDGCDAPTHLACTQPRLRRVPKGDWFCPTCTDARVADAPDAAAKGSASAAAAEAPAAEVPAAAPAPAAKGVRGRRAAAAAQPVAAADPAAAAAVVPEEEAAPAPAKGHGKRGAAASRAAEPAPAHKRTRRAATQEREAPAPAAEPATQLSRKFVAPAAVTKTAPAARATRMQVATVEPAKQAAAPATRATRARK